MPEITLTAAGLPGPATPEVPALRILAARDLARREVRHIGLTDPGEIESCVKVAQSVVELGGTGWRAVEAAKKAARNFRANPVERGGTGVKA